MLKTNIVCSEGPYQFQLLCFNENTRVIKLYGRKIYWRLFKFMNHVISTGQKYLPENYLFPALKV